MPKLSLDALQKIVKNALGEVRAEQWREGQKVSRTHSAELVDGATAVKQVAQVAAKGRYFADALKSKAVEEMTVEERGNMAARAIKYLYRSNGNHFAACEMAKASGEQSLSGVWEKALSAGSLADGGAIIPPEFSSAIIELLSSQSVVRDAGISIMPMNGSLTMAYIDSGSTAAYTGENTNITSSQPAFGQLQLSDKKLAALIPTSNDLLRNASPAGETVIRNDIVRAMKVKENSTFIRGLGGSGEPRGMRGWCPAANSFDADATVSLDNTTDDLSTAVFNLENADVDMEGAGWIISPRTKTYLQNVRATDGYPFRAEMAAGTILGFPFHSTTAIPNNLGAGTASEVYFASFPTLVIAESEALMVEVFPGGAYHNGSSVVSGISQDQTVVRAIALHDFGARQRGAEISLIEAVLWGA